MYGLKSSVSFIDDIDITLFNNLCNYMEVHGKPNEYAVGLLYKINASGVEINSSGYRIRRGDITVDDISDKALLFGFLIQCEYSVRSAIYLVWKIFDEKDYDPAELENSGVNLYGIKTISEMIETLPRYKGIPLMVNTFRTELDSIIRELKRSYIYRMQRKVSNIEEVEDDEFEKISKFIETGHF